MSDNTLTAKWLRTLFYIHIALLAATCLSWLPIQDQWITWFKWALTIGTALCLTRLSSNHSRYTKAALFRILYIGGTMVNSLLFFSPVIVLAAAIFSILGTYQEYHAHSQLITEKDAVLSRKWSRLFGLTLLVEILVSFVSSILSVAITMLHWDNLNIIPFVTVAQSIPQLFVRVLYLIYMNRTVRLLEAEEGDYYGN